MHLMAMMGEMTTEYQAMHLMAMMGEMTTEY
jgi:hypothetical protein